MAAKAFESDIGTRLRKAVAEFFEVDEDAVGPGFSLRGRRGQGSIARAALDSAIRRRVGLTSRSVYTARTYGELKAALVPGNASDTALRDNGQDVALAPQLRSAAPADIPASGAVRCGIDIELIDFFPRLADCWEDPFYRNHFTPAEIAYCLLQETPVLHFAARWCAKEALKKCDSAFLTIAMKDLEVVTDNAGAPSLMEHAGGGARRLPHAVSLSHTPYAAAAVVVTVDLPAAVPIPLPLAAVAAPPLSSSSRLLGSVVPTLLSLIALGTAIVGLLRTFPIVR